MLFGIMMGSMASEYPYLNLIAFTHTIVLSPAMLGLIRWGLVIHGFIDGYSRLITALRASDNNCADTVLDLFLDAAQQYHVPSRVRGDHGVENLRIAEYMEHFRGPGRGSYIWGRYVEYYQALYSN